jgi:hypothetical protein
MMFSPSASHMSIKTRAIVYRHFSLPRSYSASRFTAGASRFLNLSRMVTFLHCSLLPELSGVAVVPEVPDRKASKSNLSSRTEVGSYLVAVPAETIPRLLKLQAELW